VCICQFCHPQAAESGAGEGSDSDDDADVTAAPPLAAAEPLPADDVVAPAALPSADDVVALARPSPVQPHSRPVRGTRNANPRYRGDPMIHYLLKRICLIA
jgi:hypothetical protein